MDRIPLDRIFDSPFQARASYNNIEALAESILRQASAWPETSGLIQIPPARIVIPNGRGFKVLDPKQYGGVLICLDDEPEALVQLGAGHRRHRAFSHLLQQGHETYATMPLEIKPLSNEAMIDIMRDENAERDDLTAIEQAMQIELSMKALGLNQEQVGQRWGLGKSAVSNKLRLLKLPQEAQAGILSGHLNERHGRALLAALNKSKRIYERLAQQIVPPPSEAAVMARDLLDKYNFSISYFHNDGRCDICAACQQEIISGERYITHHLDDAGQRIDYSLCQRCRNAAAGEPAPSTKETDGLLDRSIGQERNSLDRCGFPLDVEIPAPWSIRLVCQGCPASETERETLWCMDSRCFESKKQHWRQRQEQEIGEKLVAQYGQSVPFEYGYGGHDLSETDDVDCALVREGICVPGKCERLRLRYSTVGGFKPFGDMPYIWNCNNSNSHRAAHRRYLDTNPDQAVKAKAKEEEQIRAELRAIRQQALDALCQTLEDDPDHPGIWLGLARQGDNSLSIGDKSLGQLKRIVLDEMLEDMGLYRRPMGYWEMMGPDKYRTEVQDRLLRIGISLPNGQDRIESKLNRIANWVVSFGAVVPGEAELDGNVTNLNKLIEELDDLIENDPDEAKRERAEESLATAARLLQAVVDVHHFVHDPIFASLDDAARRSNISNILAKSAQDG